MKYTPLTDSEINNLNPTLQPGIVSLEILEAVPGKTAAGKDKIRLKMLATDASGITSNVWDSLLSPELYEDRAKAFVLNRLKTFCASFKINYESGVINASEIIGKTGYGFIAKKDDGYFDIKTYRADSTSSDISDIISKHEQELPPVHASAPESFEDFDDKIPF